MFCQLPCKRTLLPPVRITSVWATSKPTVALFTASHHFVCVLSGLRVWWFEFRGDLNCDLFVGPRDFSVYPTLVPFQMTTPGKPFNANFLFCFVSILPLLYFHSPNQMNSMSSMSQSQLIASISAIVQQQVTAAMQTIATANSSVANPALPPAAIECTTPLVSNGLSRSNSLGSSTSALTRSGSTMSSVANPALPPAAIEFTTPLVSNGLSRSNSLGSSTSALTRSGSTMSTESSSSTSSQKGYQSFIVDSETEEEEEQQPRKKRMRRLRRRRSTDQRNDDRKQISRAVLTELDNIYLAPRHSKLFRRVFKKARNPDGTRSYKQNADIDMPLFRSLVRPILRRVLGNAVATDRHLAMRYYHAALSVVKKRRANHVQEWRLKGESKPLIYGGRKELFPSRYEPLPTYTHTLITHTHSLTHLPTHRTQSNASASAAAAACIAARDSSSQQESQSPDSDEAGMSDETELYESDGDETRGPPVHGPPCSNLHCIKTTCADCGVVFEYNSPLAESSKRIVRCGACFDKFVQAEYVELIHDNQDSGHEARKRANGKRDSKGKKKSRNEPRANTVVAPHTLDCAKAVRSTPTTSASQWTPTILSNRPPDQLPNPPKRPPDQLPNPPNLPNPLPNLLNPSPNLPNPSPNLPNLPNPSPNLPNLPNPSPNLPNPLNPPRCRLSVLYVRIVQHRLQHTSALCVPLGRRSTLSGKTVTFIVPRS